MAKNITKVPDGPLVKKKGPFKGSTLKAGGKIKKAQDGEVIRGSRKGLGEFKTVKEKTTVGGVTKPYKYTRTSIDTTGYSKGKPQYDLKTQEGEGDLTGYRVKDNSSKKVLRKEVPSILKSMKK